MLNKEWPKHTILAIAIVATWLKTYIAYQTGFSITVENRLQEFILFLSPLSLLLFLYGLSLFFKSEKNRNRYLIAMTLITSVILYGNIAFYRFFSDFITLPVLFQTDNFGDLGSSAAASIYPTDLFYFTDLILLVAAVKFLRVKKESESSLKFQRSAYFIFSAAVLFLNLGLAES